MSKGYYYLMVPIPSKMVYKRVRNYYYYYFGNAERKYFLIKYFHLPKNSRFTVIRTLFEFVLKLLPM